VSLKDSWFKFFQGLWLQGTRQLSYEAKGLYIDLIAMWRDGMVVPNDSRWIARQSGYPNHRTSARPLGQLLAAGKIYVDGEGNLRNAKVEDDLAARAEQRANRPTRQVDEGQRQLPFRPRLVRNSGDK
jgi:uncharacterized protein YdaU (DUF1376 family)